MSSMARLESLPEELVEQIFQEFALQIPIHRLIRLRLVSKFFNARLMSPRVFPIATHEWHINFCQDKDTIMKWLRWSFRDPDCRNPVMKRFRQIVDQFLRLAGEKYDDHRRRTEEYNVDSVSEVLLTLVADLLLVYRWTTKAYRASFFTYNQLLWWRKDSSLDHPEVHRCICLTIASAFGDIGLVDSIFEETLLESFWAASRYVGLPVYAAVRFGHTHLLHRLLGCKGDMQRRHPGWTILDQAIYSDRQHQLPAVLLEVAYRFDLHLYDATEEQMLHDVLIRALETAATYRNYKALKMLLSHQAKEILPLSDMRQHYLLFAACLGQDSGFDMAKHLFAILPTLTPNCVVRSPYHFGGWRDRRDMRPLDAAIIRGDVPLVQLLLEHGAAPDFVGNPRDTPIEPPVSFRFAARQGFVNCMTLLLKAGLGHHYLSGGAIVDASLSGDPAAVELLLDAGVQLNPTYKMLVMANAYVAGTESVIELLRSRGYDSEEARSYGDKKLMDAMCKTRIVIS